MRAPAGKAKDAKRSDVRWLTPRAWRRWVDVGLRGHGAAGLPDPEWAGRLEDRNAAFADLLYSSGMRLSEGGSLLTFEVSSIRLRGGRYYVGRIAAAVTRSKKSRTFYVAVHVLGEVEAYRQGLRAGRAHLLAGCTWRLVLDGAGYGRSARRGAAGGGRVGGAGAELAGECVTEGGVRRARVVDAELGGQGGGV